MKYFVEELGIDPNLRDMDGYSPVHHSAARGDNETILYLVDQGADVTLVSRRGQTTADMANSPEQRAQPHPATIALLRRNSIVADRAGLDCGLEALLVTALAVTPQMVDACRCGATHAATTHRTSTTARAPATAVRGNEHACGHEPCRP